jgi:DNA-binding YbaB/EbfC family protein
MDIAKMMQQAQKMQEDMASVQENLSNKHVEASVGGGKVVVTANAAGDIEAIKIAQEILDPEDVEMLEDLVLSGVRQALEQGKKVQAEEMSKVTAGLGLPPGLGL